MKQLTCEMCGSTDLIKQDGVFVCQNCGTKYSVEEAKKMMMEGSADTSGPAVKVDRSAELDNYRNIMINSFNATNYNEASSYASKVLEITDDYLAYYIKGTSAGWQSTVGNPRLREAVENWKLSLEKVPMDEAAFELCNNIANDFRSISDALLNGYFETYGDDLSDDRFTKKAMDLNQFIIMESILLVSAYNLRIPEEERNNPDITKPTECLIQGMSYLRPSAFKKYYDKKSSSINDSIRLYKSSMPESFTSKLSRYFVDWRVLINFIPTQDQAECLNYCKSLLQRTQGTLRTYAHPAYASVFDRTVSDLNSEIQKVHRKEAEEREKKLAEERKKQEEKNQKYWEQHAAEKEALETKKREIEERRRPILETLSQKRNELNETEKDLAVVPLQNKWREIKDQIKGLETRRANLGVFKGKEKKEITAAIAALYDKLPTNDDIKNEEQELRNKKQPIINELRNCIADLEKKNSELDEEIKKIDNELTKDR